MITDKHINRTICWAIAGLIVWIAYSQYQTKKSVMNVEFLLTQNEQLNLIRTTELNKLERKMK